MTTKQVLALSTYDKIKYAGQTAFVADWKCNREPTFAVDGTRIDAEPLFQFPDSQRRLIHPRFWNEIESG